MEVPASSGLGTFVPFLLRGYAAAGGFRRCEGVELPAAAGAPEDAEVELRREVADPDVSPSEAALS